MNWRGVRGVVRRDLQVALRSKAVVLPAVVVSVLLLVLLPAAAGVLPQTADAFDSGEIRSLLRVLPFDVYEALPEEPGLRAAYVMVVYMLSPMVLLVPVLFATVIAADGVAGEKERGTLEGLLLTPLTDRELATAKLAAAWLPAIALGIGGAAVYALVANVTVGTQLDRLVLPTVEFTLMTLWVGPTFAAAALGAVSLVSVRVSTTQEALQVGGVVVIPVAVLLISQASGALLLSPWVLVVIGLVGAAIAVALVALAARGLSRARLGPRLG